MQRNIYYTLYMFYFNTDMLFNNSRMKTIKCYLITYNLIIHEWKHI